MRLLASLRARPTWGPCAKPPFFAGNVFFARAGRCLSSDLARGNRFAITLIFSFVSILVFNLGFKRLVFGAPAPNLRCLQAILRNFLLRSKFAETGLDREHVLLTDTLTPVVEGREFATGPKHLRPRNLLHAKVNGGRRRTSHRQPQNNLTRQPQNNLTRNNSPKQNLTRQDAEADSDSGVVISRFSSCGSGDNFGNCTAANCPLRTSRSRLSSTDQTNRRIYFVMRDTYRVLRMSPRTPRGALT